MNYPIDENLFHSAPSQPLQDSGTADAAVYPEETTYAEPAAEELLPPPDFKSFFTLIEDPETGEHHHPTVHYIFSDDDPEILTAAALEALDEDKANAGLVAQQNEVQERYVVVDMAADGKSIASASSLSPDWQALKTSISQAPDWNQDSRSGDGSLMLKISGQVSRPIGTAKPKKSQPQPGNLDDLVKTFSERLQGLGDVLGRTQGAQMEQDMI